MRFLLDFGWDDTVIVCALSFVAIFRTELWGLLRALLALLRSP